MGMTNQKISIIVPVYRTEAYLKRCVDSLLGQTYQNIEIILVDDGSPDSCPGMCDTYAKEDNRVKTLHKENGGLVLAWQTGVLASTGEYLCFVDSDDWVETDMLAGMVPYLSEEKELPDKEIVCCNFVINRQGQREKETKHFHALPPGIYEGDRLEHEIKKNLLGHENRMVSMSRCMKLFSRSLIEDNMEYCNPRITMGEDVNIVLPALLDSRRVVIMEQALYYHYLHNDESMSHKYDSSMYEGIRTLYSVIEDIFVKKGRKDGETQSKKEYIYLLFLALKNEIRGGRKDYLRNIKEICSDSENRETLRQYPVTVQNKVNRLLYFILKHPKSIYIRAIHLLFLLFSPRAE